MKILIIGQGGREHAIAWKIAQSHKVSTVYVAPGNAGTANEHKVQNIDIATDDLNSLVNFAKNNQVNLTIVGPETPLTLGIVDLFSQNNLIILGPNKAAAKLEGSKAFCKQILNAANVNTAAYKEFTQHELHQALTYIKTKKTPYVIKADGLASGKGVHIIYNPNDGTETITNMLHNHTFGRAGQKVVIEDFIYGQEASFIVLVSNNIIIPLASSQDHKTRDNYDKGPNTGGMGAYSPAPMITPQKELEILNTIIQPTIDQLAQQGINYSGFLYAGLMFDQHNNISVLEFNCRLGDPETQAILPRLESDFYDLCYLAATNSLEQMPKLQWSKQSAITVVLASRNYPEQPTKDEIITVNNNKLTKLFHSATYLDSDHQLRSNGGRVLNATQLGVTLATAQYQVYEEIKHINWSNMFFRTDIGAKAV